MKKELLSPEAVLEKIGAESFRNISKEKLIAFVSAIPEMDKATAIKCIEQFPEFRRCANEIVGELKDVSFELLKNQKESHEKAILGYQTILDSLSQLLKQPKLSVKEEHYIIEKMIYVTDKMDELQRENEEFLKHVMHVFAGLASGAIAIGGAILGVKIIGKK